MRVVVTGGRDFKDGHFLAGVLDAIHKVAPISKLAQGGASGADELASNWAMWNSIPQILYTANWKQHGRAAGPIRNENMLREFDPDLVVAFKGGRGTADCVRQAEKMGIKVIKTWQQSMPIE